MPDDYTSPHPSPAPGGKPNPHGGGPELSKPAAGKQEPPSPPAAPSFQQPPAPSPGVSGPVYMQPAPSHAVGAENSVLAMVFAILSLPFCCGLFGLIPIIMGAQARAEARRTGRPLDSTMNAAYIIGIIGMVLMILILIGYGLLFALADPSTWDSDPSYYDWSTNT